ncbi:MAG TPA: alpha/beta hydrolase [Flavobacterium sp.]|nr:alpha/beta hydrolase [Flavobacterium sp.]
MKKLIAISFIAVLLWSCDSSEENLQGSNTANSFVTPMFRTYQQQIPDLAYGNDPQQKMDVYFPLRPSDDKSKVFVIVHGGGWYSGDKAGFNSEVLFIRTFFPEYTVVNLNYRLATKQSIGNPKQVQDIAEAIKYLDDHSDELHILREYAMIGVSAGAHLSMLYSYKYDTAHEVKAVCSIVGPTDFSDHKYWKSALYISGLNYFTGYNSYLENPALYNSISPAQHVNAQSPKTIMFYGDSDPLVASTQGAILSARLSAFGVYNELYQYPGAGHANWNAYQQTHVNEKTIAFFRRVF